MVNNIPNNILKFIGKKGFSINNIGFSDSTVLIYDDMVLKIENDVLKAKETVIMMKWLKGKIPVPEVIYHEVSNNKSYLLMSRITGKMSCDEFYLEQPEKLLAILSEALKSLWKINVSDCPRNKNIDTKLKEVRKRVENGLVNLEEFDKSEFKNPEELLLWLEKNKPDDEPVLSHGDFCLPNIILEDDKINGFIDLGDSGISDKWYDIAICYRSLKNNFSGIYGGKVYPDFDPNALFKALNLKPNHKKLRYFLLMEELF